MGSTCSTLDGVDAPRGRASQVEQEQREKDAAALEYEIQRWMEADEECRALQTDVTFDPRESSRRQSQPRGFDAAGSGKVRFATDHVTVVPMPTLEEMGPHLTKQVFYSQSDFDRMMTERKKLSVKAARFARQHDLFDKSGTPVPVDKGESRRGMGIEPWEQAILGSRKARNERIKRYNAQIVKLHVQATKSVADPWASEDPSNPAGALDEYTYVAAKANEMDATIYKMNHESAERAHALAEKDHRLVSEGSGDSAAHVPKASIFTQLAHLPHPGFARTPARAKPRRESVPTRRDDSSGYDSDCSRHSDDSNYESLDADQFHRLLRADSFNNHAEATLPGRSVSESS